MLFQNLQLIIKITFVCCIIMQLKRYQELPEIPTILNIYSNWIGHTIKEAELEMTVRSF